MSAHFFISVSLCLFQHVADGVVAQSEKVLEAQVGRIETILVESAGKRPVVFADSAEKTGADGIETEHVQGRTPHGYIVNVALPVPPGVGVGREYWIGKQVKVCIRSACKHSLRAAPV